MKFSHSRIETYNLCPYKFRLRYLDEVEIIDDFDNASHPLIVGSTMHDVIENGLQVGIKNYFNSFPLINDAHVNEQIKFEGLYPKVMQLLPDEMIFEYEINTNEFHGFIDAMSVVGNNIVDIYDFKYSNHDENYYDSPQLHLYKYYLERTSPYRVRDMYYVMIPKTFIRQKKSEDLRQFRERLKRQVELLEPHLMKVNYNESKVYNFKLKVKEIEEKLEYHNMFEIFDRNYTKSCDYCEFYKICKGEEDYMQLPSSTRRTVGSAKKRKIWIYGASMSGKTSVCDDAPTPLNLNTDGNIEFVTMPYISIKDEVTVEGRITKRKFAWQVLLETLSELEKKQNDFETIIIDLLEDTYEQCRLYMYDKMGITHESDDPFKAWDKVRTEFLSTMRRFFNLPYQNLIVISHEDSSRDLTKRTGDKVTKIAPNIQEKIANKIAGMVDIVARVVVDDDKTRTLNFKSNEVIFGGGRLKNIKSTQIDLSWDALMSIYEVDKESQMKTYEPESFEGDINRVVGEVEEPQKDDIAFDETKKRRTRKRKSSNDEVQPEPLEEDVIQEEVEVKEEPTIVEEKPKRRTRRKRGE